MRLRLYAKGLLEKVVARIVKGFFKFLGFLHLTPMFFVGIIGAILYFTGALENQTVMIVFNVVLGLSGVYAIVGIIVGLTRKGKEKGKKKRGNVDVVESGKAEESVNQNEQTAPPVAPMQPYTTPVENSVSSGVKYYEVRQNPSLVMAEYPDRYVLFRKTANGLVKIRTDYK